MASKFSRLQVQLLMLRLGIQQVSSMPLGTEWTFRSVILAEAAEAAVQEAVQAAVYFSMFHEQTTRKGLATMPELVGSPGEVAQGTTDVAPEYAQTVTEGNFLYCWVWSNSSSETNPIDFDESNISESWNFLQRAGVPYNWIAVLYKEEAGSVESAPVFTHTDGSQMAAQLTEWADCGAIDFVGYSDEAGESDAPNADTVAGDLIIGLFTWNGNNANPSINHFLYGSDGEEVSHTVLSVGEGSAAPFWVHSYGIGPDPVGETPNKQTCSITQFENAPAGVIVSVKPAS